MNKAKRFVNHTADQCYQCLLAACVYLFLFPCGAINLEAEQSDHHQKVKLQCSVVNCLRGSAVIMRFESPLLIGIVTSWINGSLSAHQQLGPAGPYSKEKVQVVRLRSPASSGQAVPPLIFDFDWGIHLSNGPSLCGSWCCWSSG